MDKPKFKILEDGVDDLWLAILNYYFRDDFIVRQNARLSQGAKTKVDLVVESVVGVNDTQHVVLLVEDKRPPKEAQNAAWSGAVKQLTEYMLQARAQDQNHLKLEPTDHLPYSTYGIVNVGKYSRFYVLHPDQTTLQDLPSSQGKPYHVKNDELGVAAILTELVTKTTPRGLSSVSSSSSAPSVTSSRHPSPAPASRPGSSSGATRTASPAAQAKTATPAAQTGQS